MALRIKAIKQYSHSGKKDEAGANTAGKVFTLQVISCHINLNIQFSGDSPEHMQSRVNRTDLKMAEYLEPATQAFKPHKYRFLLNTFQQLSLKYLFQFHQK